MWCTGVREGRLCECVYVCVVRECVREIERDRPISERQRVKNVLTRCWCLKFT